MNKLKTLLVLSVVAVAAMLHAGFESSKIYKQHEFAVRSRAASGAIFLIQEDGKRRFICSGTTIGHAKNGDALFLTARHCVWQDASDDEENGPSPAKLLGLEEISFSDNEAGPYYTAVPYKISKTDDVAILELRNGTGLPTVALGDENRLRAGDTLTNYTFALDLGKIDILLKAVVPAFTHFPVELLKNYPMWAHSMPVDGLVAPGSSGSGLFDPRQRALVGIVVGGGPRLSTLAITIPVSRVWNLLGDPNNVQDLSVPKPLTKIPDDVFAAQFGPEHPFTLTVHGPSPEFIQAGYKFRVNSEGYEISDDYYYKVPVYVVYISGEYRIVSTKGTGYSIDLTFLGKA
jgi:hypothetical protein